MCQSNKTGKRCKEMSDVSKVLHVKQVRKCQYLTESLQLGSRASMADLLHSPVVQLMYVSSTTTLLIYCTKHCQNLFQKLHSQENVLVLHSFRFPFNYPPPHLNFLANQSKQTRFVTRKKENWHHSQRGVFLEPSCRLFSLL